MRNGTRLAVDVGSVRVGIAKSDPLGHMSIPLETVKRDRHGRDIARIVRLCREADAIEVVVGLPRHLNGEEGTSAAAARRFARALKKRLGETRVCMVDERLSSGQAHSRLSEIGVDSRVQRQIVDQVAAQVILDQALELERLSGMPPGEEVLIVSPKRGNSE